MDLWENATHYGLVIITVMMKITFWSAILMEETAVNLILTCTGTIIVMNAYAKMKILQLQPLQNQQLLHHGQLPVVHGPLILAMGLLEDAIQVGLVILIVMM